MRTGRALADGGLALAVTSAAVALTAGLASELTWSDLVDGFVLSNVLIGLSLAVAAYPVTRARPENATGWMLLAGGCAYLLSAGGYALLAWGTSPGEGGPGWRLLADVTSLGWPLAVAFFIPMTLLLFPDGHLVGDRWRAAAGLAVLAAVLFSTAMAAADDTTTTPLGVDGYLRVPWADSAVLGIALNVSFFCLMGAAVASLVVRYRRGDEMRRRQVLWLLLATLVMVTTFAVSALLALESWFGIVVIVLVPTAIVIAILRHQLLDIRLVVSRSVLYLVLTSATIAAYVLLVAVADRALVAKTPLASPALATVAVALAFNPVRSVLQRRVDRLFYGTRHDPVHAVAQIGSHLDEAGLAGLLVGLCTSLRFPWATIRVDGAVIAQYGHPDGASHEEPLSLGGGREGALTLGLRAGERRLSRKDARALEAVGGSVTVAVRASLAADELQSAREALVSLREEERRRLGRELHDGVGPALTGVTLLADAARRLVATDPEGAARLLAELRRQTTTVVEEIRRLAQQLRPPALDSLGLRGALVEFARTCAPLRVEVCGPIPLLDPAAEVAAYRIVTEALTNVVRHSSATSATVTLRREGSDLLVSVSDDGANGATVWQEGVGLASMRERASELGGSMSAGPRAEGGLVNVTLPIGAEE